MNSEIACGLLRSRGMETIRAADGERGVSLFASSTEGFYAAVLMDIRMPVMNGYEASKAIRALDRRDAKTVPIIAMTADAFEDDVKRCREAGMNSHVAKPVHPETLFRELEKLIRRRNA
jgi:two-component system, sensor histidine kinase and response regulator